jgi:hypothetical protein
VEAGAYDALLVSGGRVLDAPTANVWARFGDTCARRRSARAFCLV